MTTADPAVLDAFAEARAALVSADRPRTCRRCLREGREASVTDPQAERCPRCQCALRGNRGPRKHGLRSRPEIHPDQAREFLDRVDRILRDKGHTADDGSDPAAYVLTSQSASYVRLEMMEETAFAAVATKGASSKTRLELVKVIAAKARLAEQIGLDRRQRGIDVARHLSGQEDA